MISFRQVAKKMDPVKPPRRLRGVVSPGTLGLMDYPEKGLWSVHRWLATEAQPLSLRRILERHQAASTTTHRFLFYNTWLLNLQDVAELIEDNAPDLSGRSRDIGRHVRAYYDIAALCEVWDAEELRRIRAPLRGFSDATGPGGDWNDKSAGLVTFVRNENRDRAIDYEPPLPPLDPDYHTTLRSIVFDERGNRSRDADAWSNKGVLRTVIDVGVGKIDLYTAHLFSGGGLLGDPSEEERRNIQLSQLRELVQFVRWTHRREHIIVVAGDFNIHGNDEDAYPELVRYMATLGLKDIWEVRGGKHGSTFLTESSPAERCIFNARQAGSRNYCDDYAIDDRNDYGRIDYVFVEDPSPSHEFDLDITRVQRRPFFRNLTGSGRTDQFMVGDRPNYLSDHLGLEMEWIASGRDL